MIAETLFCAELLRPMRTQKFRDHAVAAMVDDRPCGQGGRIGANEAALCYKFAKLPRDEKFPRYSRPEQPSDTSRHTPPNGIRVILLVR
jgi:hypothetical protein